MGLGAMVVVAVAGLAAAAGADGIVTITPSSGAPGTGYTVQVTCGQFPELKQRHTQDARVQGTIAPYGPGELVEVSPSIWQAAEVAGETDEEYGARCGDAQAGSGRFDAEAPHLWFGPRPRYLGAGEQLAGRTTVEGTDCPAGSQASVEIRSGADVEARTAPIDQYGDWTVHLPRPVGDVELEITASCGSVDYDRLVATTTTPPTTGPPTSGPPTSAPPASRPTTATPASARRGTSDFTG